MSLAVHDLDVVYDVAGRSRRVVRDVDLHVDDGELLGLVGESGCGKSTLALALARRLDDNGRITRGSIVVDGTDVVPLAGEQLRRWRASSFAMVYQEPGRALNPTMRVGDQVAEVLELAGLGRAGARTGAVDLLERMALTDPAAVALRYPHQLSGGQQQRVVIAMAVAARPRLLVLDEPTTGLDVTVEAGVLGLIADLGHELGAAVILITHNLALVAETCDRVAVLYAGEIVEHGDVGDVVGQPQHPYSAALLGCVPSLTAPRGELVLRPIGGAPPADADGVAGCSFAPRCDRADDRCRVDAPVLDPAGDRPRSARVRCHHAGTSPPTVVVPEPRPTRGSGGPLLEVHGLTKCYGDVVACDDVSIDVCGGEVLGLVGESGSGKTTLARCIVGLSAPDTGTVLLEGEDLPRGLRRRRAGVRRRLQMVFQSPDASLNSRHTARRILTRAVERLGGRRTVDELAGQVQLSHSLLDVRTTRLSGGEKQRVALGRALAGEPSIVVCDEPVSALDVSVQAGVLELLGDLQAEQDLAYLFISHDLGVVRYLADRVAVMYRGQVVEVGPADSVFSPAHHPYTDALLAAVPRIDQVGRRRAASRPAGQPAPAPAPSAGCVFAGRCPRRIAGRCESDAPPWRRLDEAHHVRCHLSVAELRSGAATSAPIDGAQSSAPVTAPALL